MSLIPNGFFPGNSCAGPTPFCPPGLSKNACRRGALCGGPVGGKRCCACPSPCATCPGVPSHCSCSSCSFAFPPPPGSTTDPEGRGIFTTVPPCTGKYFGFTDVGFVYNTDARPVTNFLTKSCTLCDLDPYGTCRSGQCTGCRSAPIDSAMGLVGDYLSADSTAVPPLYLPELEHKVFGQRRESAFQRPTQFTNYNMDPLLGDPLGGPHCTSRNSRAGWNYGTLHATGCKCNRCNQDVFYHPRTTVLTPLTSRKYQLLARSGCSSSNNTSRFEYAVIPAGVVDPPLLVLPHDPRQPNGCGTCTVDFQEQAWVELKEGDVIYIPGELGQYFVHFWAEDDGVFRPNNAVFRGWSPVRKLMGRINVTNSGLRNFTSLPDPDGLLRPF